MGLVLILMALSIWGVIGTWVYGWRREDLKVLVVIGGAWVGWLINGRAGIWYGVAVIVGWWAARLVVRIVRWVRRVAADLRSELA